MEALIDDVGSFPLPDKVDRKTFDKAYVLSREAILNGEDLRENEFILNNFYNITLASFRKKSFSGLDIVNYPQQYDGMKQVADVIHSAMVIGTFLVEEKQAFLPEVHVIGQEAKYLSEEFGKQILLRVSLFGPIEQYLREIGTVPYSDILDNFAQTIRRFAKHSILNSKYIKTKVISIDEPSFGYLTIGTTRDELCAILEKAFDFQGVTRQIHLHSAARLPDLLCVKNIDVLSFEYAGSPKNIEAVSKKMLEEADKQIRIGVSRTDIDSILSELQENGIAKPTSEQLVEGKEHIRKRYINAKSKYGEAMTFTGPDCGLGSWPSQEAALLLLKRTVEAVKGK
jgi:5-methyltetrahydropteroyltriglutamate--homocysteine methyltransferase